MNKVSLVINSKNPNEQFLMQCLNSAKAFDEIVLYLDSWKISQEVKDMFPSIVLLGDGKSRNIGQGLNFAISQSKGDWICPFCDDDYFHLENIAEAIILIKSGQLTYEDILHSQVTLDDGGLWGSSSVSLPALLNNNIIPFGSIYKREVFEKLSGYSEVVGAYNDWNFWLRAAKAGFRFRYFEKPIYHFRQGHDSATNRLLAEIGGHGQAIRQVLENA